MSPSTTERAKDPSAWLASDLRDNAWLYHFSADELDELESARARVEACGLRWGEFGWGDFPIPILKPKLDAANAALKYGRGVVQFRGLEVDKYDLDQLKTIYWGLGVHMGQPCSQNRKGDLIGHVEAVPGARARQGDRGYWRPSALPFHTDYSDAVGLLCVRKAREGGVSVIASSTAIHDYIERCRPDLLPPLYAGMHTNLRNEGPTRADSEPSPQPVPIFDRHKGLISCFYSQSRYLSGQEATGCSLSPLQLEALAYVSEVAQTPEFKFEIELRPGDLQFLNCHTTLHSRTDYVDYDAPKRTRFLLRLWLRFEEEDYRVSPERARIFRWGVTPSRAALV